MKFIMMATILIFFTIGSFGVVSLREQVLDLLEENNRIRRERDMFAKLYRTANTTLCRYQDSINQHCICK